MPTTGTVEWLAAGQMQRTTFGDQHAALLGVDAHSSPCIRMAFLALGRSRLNEAVRNHCNRFVVHNSTRFRGYERWVSGICFLQCRAVRSENECKITQIFPDKSAFFALAFAPIFYRARKTLIFTFRFDSTMFFLFISFECFYSAGVQDLMIKTIRKLACEEFLAAKHAKRAALKAVKSVYVCLCSFLFLLIVVKCG